LASVDALPSDVSVVPAASYRCTVRPDETPLGIVRVPETVTVSPGVGAGGCAAEEIAEDVRVEVA
jgi:hypothetical protein